MQGRYDQLQRLYVTFSEPNLFSLGYIGAPVPQDVYVYDHIGFSDNMTVVLVPKVVPLWERIRNGLVNGWGRAWDFLNRPVFPGLATRLFN
jgi:hypothetical protein